MENEDLPGQLSQVPFHGPLSQARAARLTERLTRNQPRTVLDIGCGWGELMLQILAAAPDATGVGIDLDEDDLARGRAAAQARGLANRATFARESGAGTTRGPPTWCCASGPATRSATSSRPAKPRRR
jgi:tRNA G46 methylase TrmB